MVSWYSLWCAVAVTILFSFLALSFCLYKAFLLRKRVQSGVSTSPVTEALLGPSEQTVGKEVGTPSTEASPGRCAQVD